MFRLILLLTLIPSLLARYYPVPVAHPTSVEPSTLSPSSAFTKYCNTSLHFYCHDSSKPCIPLEWICDGVHDCPTGLDEAHCSYLRECPPKQLMCRNGECVSAEYRCDGEMDCMDGSDEKGCEEMAEIMEKINSARLTQASSPVTTTVAPRRSLVPSQCGPREYRCESGSCIDAQAKCDGVWDCPAGDDETRCTDSVSPGVQSVGSVTKCQHGYFMCADRLACVPNKWKCDGELDCNDGSDEADCLRTSEEEVSLLLDEMMRPREPSTLPPQSTTTTTSSPVSITSGRYEYGAIRMLEERLKELDQENASSTTVASTTSTAAPTADSVIDHCVGAQCSQYCINKADGFECSCVTGYELLMDDRTCVMPDYIRKRQLSKRNKPITVQIVPDREEEEDRKIDAADLYSVFTLHTNVPSAKIKPELYSQLTAKLADLLNYKPWKYIVVHIVGDQKLAVGGDADAPAAVGTIKSLEYVDPGMRREFYDIRYLIEQNLGIARDRLNLKVVDTYGWDS